jgi:hypothetical protein
MTNSKLVPKNTNFSKKSKIIQKSLNFPKKPKISKKANIWQKAKFWIILAFLAFLANFGFILALLEIFGFHVAYIGGTYRVQKSDVDDSVEGTEKAM